MSHLVEQLRDIEGYRDNAVLCHRAAEEIVRLRFALVEIRGMILLGRQSQSDGWFEGCIAHIERSLSVTLGADKHGGADAPLP